MLIPGAIAIEPHNVYVRTQRAPHDRVGRTEQRHGAQSDRRGQVRHTGIVADVGVEGHQGVGRPTDIVFLDDVGGVAQSVNVRLPVPLSFCGPDHPGHVLPGSPKSTHSLFQTFQRRALALSAAARMNDDALRLAR